VTAVPLAGTSAATTTVTAPSTTSTSASSQDVSGPGATGGTAPAGDSSPNPSPVDSAPAPVSPVPSGQIPGSTDPVSSTPNSAQPDQVPSPPDQVPSPPDLVPPPPDQVALPPASDDQPTTAGTDTSQVILQVQVSGCHAYCQGRPAHWAFRPADQSGAGGLAAPRLDARDADPGRVRARLLWYRRRYHGSTDRPGNGHGSVDRPGNALPAPGTTRIRAVPPAGHTEPKRRSTNL
jgi:hypothetical protein